MSTAVDAALVEVTAAIAVLLPDQTGANELEDIPRQLGETRQAVDVIKMEVDRRMNLLVALQAAAVALVADGYPTVPTLHVPAEVDAEIQKNLEALEAVRKLFISFGPPVTGRVTFEAPTA